MKCFLCFILRNGIIINNKFESHKIMHHITDYISRNKLSTDKYFKLTVNQQYSMYVDEIFHDLDNNITLSVNKFNIEKIIVNIAQDLIKYKIIEKEKDKDFVITTINNFLSDLENIFLKYKISNNLNELYQKLLEYDFKQKIFNMINKYEDKIELFFKDCTYGKTIKICYYDDYFKVNDIKYQTIENVLENIDNIIKSNLTLIAKLYEQIIENKNKNIFSIEFNNSSIFILLKNCDKIVISYYYDNKYILVDKNEKKYIKDINELNEIIDDRIISVLIIDKSKIKKISDDKYIAILDKNDL